VTGVKELYQEARGQFKNGNYAEAIHIFERLLEYNPNLIEIMNNLALCYVKLGNLDKAIEIYTRIREIDPKKEFLWRNLSIIYYRREEFDKVIEVCKEGLNINPENALFWNNLAVAYSHMDNNDEVIKCYIKALDIDSNYKSAWLNLCIAYLRKGVIFNFDFEKFKPNTEVAWYFLSKVLYQAALFEDAIESCNHCLDLNPGFHAVYILRNKIKMSLKRKTIHQKEKTKISSKVKEKIPEMNERQDKSSIDFIEEDPYFKRFKKFQEKKQKRSIIDKDDKSDNMYERFKKVQQKIQKRNMEPDYNLKSSIEDEENKNFQKDPLFNVLPEGKKQQKEAFEKNIKIFSEVSKSKEIFINNKYYRIKDIYFVIDGANVALDKQTTENKGRLSSIEMIRKKFAYLGIKMNQFKIICDKSLRYNIDEPSLYLEQVNRDQIIETPAGTEADHFILQFAREKSGFVISNDRFMDFYGIFGKEWIQERRITFKLIDNKIFFDKIYQIDK